MERYIGHGYTNNKGIAKLQYDNTGTQLNNTGVQGYGKGKLDLKAKIHQDSATQSDPYTVWDTILQFDGKTTTKYLDYNSEKVTVTPSSEGSHIVANGLYSVDVFLCDDNTASNPNAHSLDGTKDLIFEFDLKVNQQMQINLRDNSGNRVAGYVPSYPSTNFRHWKWIYSASAHTCDVYEDDNQGIPNKRGTIDLSDKNMTTMGMQWIDWQSTSGETLDFWIKNFKVYYG